MVVKSQEDEKYALLRKGPVLWDKSTYFLSYWDSMNANCYGFIFTYSNFS